MLAFDKVIQNVLSYVNKLRNQPVDGISSRFCGGKGTVWKRKRLDTFWYEAVVAKTLSLDSAIYMPVKEYAA